MQTDVYKLTCKILGLLAGIFSQNPAEYSTQKTPCQNKKEDLTSFFGLY